jgi:hypothetical protein
MYHPEALPQRPKVFEHNERVSVVVADQKRYRAVFAGLTQDQKHAYVRFTSGPWQSETLLFPIEQLEARD